MQTHQFSSIPKDNFTSYFFKDLIPKSPEEYKSMTEEELIAELKKSTDFKKLVFPNAWYSKYELPLKECRDMKEFIRESPWMRTAQNYYISKEEIPAKPGGLRPILPAIEVPIEIKQLSMFSDSINQIESSGQPTTHES